MSRKRKKSLETVDGRESIAEVVKVVKLLKVLMEATKVIYIRHKGVVTDFMEVPDHTTQRRAAVELAKIMGLW
jgi:hypothetical protein